MAKNSSTVYLGYDDEEIMGKHVTQINSNTNKIGGMADWPNCDIKVPLCALCGTTRPLIVQLYAPLENSQFHRTLYIFACLNPICSQSSKAWTCIRTQHLDTQGEITVNTPIENKKKKKQPKINWCNGADDWGDVHASPVEEMDTAADEEENGNVLAMGASLIGSDAEDALEQEDDEDESTSMENDIICGFTQLEVQTDDPNANCGAGDTASAVAEQKAGGIYAEIEGAETDLVLVDTPKIPERDLIALLKHTPTPAAMGPLAKITDVTLKAYFIAVELETRGSQEYENYGGVLSGDHIRELYQEYKRQDETAGHSPQASGGLLVALEEQESYEKSLPAHGDVIFHQFISTLQQNPGQILRYSRDTLPLLIAPLKEAIPKCPNCNDDTICEVQLLPTLIPKLRLQQNNDKAPIEYGNVLVFTCVKSCWDTPDKMRYERILVQMEP